MVNVITSIEIDAPLSIVAGYAANPDNAPKWYKNIQSAVWVTKPPVSVGSKITFVAYFMRKELKYTYEVTDYHPDEILVMTTAEGPFPMQTTYKWEAISDTKTKMILQNKGEPKGFSKVFAPFMSRMMRKANKKDLREIKRIIENG